MDKESINISDELLKNLSAEEIVDLKIEVDDLLYEVNSVLEICNTALES